MDFMIELCRGTLENMGINIWKVFPFRSGNRIWLFVLLKGYFCCLAVAFLLACVLNSIEGDKWLKTPQRSMGYIHMSAPHAYGDTALDECIWFVFTTMHSCAFGEMMPRGHEGRIIALFCCSMGYWFTIFCMSIIMLSQLPGERTPTLMRTLERVFCAVWPSYSVFLFVICSVGSTLGPYINPDPYGKNEAPSGIYFIWQVAHRMPFGDLFPAYSYSRVVTVPCAILGTIYMPYALALVAVRCPTIEQHEALLGHLRSNPEDALGRGYTVPDEALLKESAPQEFTVLNHTTDPSMS